MGEIIFELKKAGFSYLNKFPALCEIDLQVEKGQRIAILGANGSGKSTLLHMLNGLFFATSGDVSVFGRRSDEKTFSDPNFSRFFRSRVGFIFQNSDTQLFCPTVEEELAFGPLQLDLPKDEVSKRIDYLCGLLEIDHIRQRPPYYLSIGEKKKVAIASVLAIDPEVILLDEPTANLDPRTITKLVETLLDASARGKTIITATHDLHILPEIADIVYVLGENKSIARSGAIGEILEDQPFLEKHNLIHVHTHRHGDKIHTHPHQHDQHHVSLPSQDNL